MARQYIYQVLTDVSRLRNKHSIFIMKAAIFCVVLLAVFAAGLCDYNQVAGCPADRECQKEKLCSEDDENTTFPEKEQCYKSAFRLANNDRGVSFLIFKNKCEIKMDKCLCGTPMTEYTKTPIGSCSKVLYLIEQQWNLRRSGHA